MFKNDLILEKGGKFITRFGSNEYGTSQCCLLKDEI